MEQSFRKDGIQRQFWEEVVRPAVLKRDNFTCQRCGEKKGELHVHHKKEGLNIFSNLITLCKSCHFGLHRKLTKKGTDIQYYEN